MHHGRHALIVSEASVLVELFVLNNKEQIVLAIFIRQPALVVVAVINGEFTVKRVARRDGRLHLASENPAMPPLELKDGMDLEVWGVVTYVIHQVD